MFGERSKQLSYRLPVKTTGIRNCTVKDSLDQYARQESARVLTGVGYAKQNSAKVVQRNLNSSGAFPKRGSREGLIVVGNTITAYRNGPR